MSRQAAAICVLGVLVPLVVFGALGWMVAMRDSPAWDFRLALFLYETSSEHGPFQAVERFFLRWADAKAIAASVSGLLVFLLATKRLRDAAFVVTAMTVVLLEPLLTEAFRRSLPLGGPGYSFPSGHAMASIAAVAAVIVLLAPTRFRWAAVAAGTLLVGCIGVSVVSDGGHWPTDVLAGWCVSLAWVSAAWLALRPVDLRGSVGSPASK